MIAFEVLRELSDIVRYSDKETMSKSATNHQQ